MPRVLNKHHYGFMPDGAVYVGRGSIYGNPWRIGDHSDPNGGMGYSMGRDEVCDRYEEWAPKQPWWEQALKDLRGKNLVCYCAPRRCHADFLLREANK